MKTLKLIALAAFALLFSQCKTTAPTAPSGQVPSLLEVRQILDTTKSLFFMFAAQTNGNPFQAIELTADRLAVHPLVKSAEAIDSMQIEIVLKSGIRTIYFYRPVDSLGTSIYRGGGPQKSGSRLTFTGKSAARTIPNKKVLIYAGAFSEFYEFGELDHIIEMLTNSIAGLEVTVLKDQQCGYQLVENFKDYGFVILDTHGDRDMFRSGIKLIPTSTENTDESFREIVKSEIGPDGYAKLLSGELIFGADQQVFQIPGWWKNDPGSTKVLNVWITTKYIDELPPMPNTILFANVCYSGYELPLRSGNTPIKTAFTNKNLISYYGFAYDDGRSESVNNDFSIPMEDSLVRALALNIDSTGHAHLDSKDGEFFDRIIADNSNFTKFFKCKHWGADNYSYHICTDVFTDNRDGSIYKAVCIGKQTWMAENLRYNAQGSKCYDDDPANCVTYGRLYDWQTVMNGSGSSSTVPSHVQGICPKGWHLPSQIEWQTLIDFCGGQATGGAALKSTSSWDGTFNGKNTSGFTALAAGVWDYALNKFTTKGAGTALWSSTEFDPVARAYFVGLSNFDNRALMSYSYKQTGGSCRCLKD